MSTSSPGASAGRSVSAQPVAPRPTLVFEQPAAVVAAQLGRLVPPAGAGQVNQRARWLTVGALCAASGLCAALDDFLGFSRAAFAWLVPFAWLGIVAVFFATSPDPPALPRWARSFAIGCLTLFLGLFVCLIPVPLFVAGVLAPLVRGEGGGALPRWLVGSAVAVLAGWLGSVVLRQARTPAPIRERLKAAAEVTEALVDDAAPDRPAQGWIDLDSPQAPAKLLRRGKSASGAPVAVYRDEWLRLRLPLRDGNRLLILAVDRVKVREGFWKRTLRGKQKWRTETSQSLCSVELRRTINPRLYRVKDDAQDNAPASTPAAGSPKTLNLALAVRQGPAFDPVEVLRGAATLYARLERTAPAAQA